MSFNLSSPIGEIKGVGEKYNSLLNKKGLKTTYDLLINFPNDYIDPEQCEKQRVREGRKTLYHLKIQKISLKRIYKKKISILIVFTTLNDSNVQLIYFNQPYLAQSLKGKKNIYIFGVINKEKEFYKSINPKIIQPEDLNQVIPIYKPVSTLKSGILKKIIKNCLSELDYEEQVIPDYLVQKYNFSDPVKTLRQIHNPSRYQKKSIESLKENFIYNEFFKYHLNMQYLKMKYKNIKRKNKYKITKKIKESLDNSVKFKLTSDQILAQQEIINDMIGDNCMQRILMGDVGTGKTIVSFIPLLIAMLNGYQAGFLAPTEVLIKQHYSNAKQFFKDFRVELLTGSTELKKKKTILRDLAEGKIDLLFGTHAILHSQVKFSSLSIIVIDEQHRFGVSQRTKMLCKAKAVDLLVTTATPIPRTLLLSMYGDLKVSTVKERPFGVSQVITRQVPNDKRKDFYRYLKQKVLDGQKVFIVLPLIEPSEFFENLYSIQLEKEYYLEIFEDLAIGFLTGRDNSLQKKKQIDSFLSGKIRILIATTVIEVGIDIPDANLIVIENAERYGLAQLHQLRGRVGRKGQKAHCYLIKSLTVSESGQKRLEILSRYNDGFKISEMDFKMRGGGIIFGQEQAGYHDSLIEDPKKKNDIFQAAAEDVRDILSKKQLRNEPLILEYIKNIEKQLKNISFS